jgi:hypothetical protein
VEEPGSTGVEEFRTDGTDGVEKRIEERIDRMLALRGGSVDEADTCTLEMLRHGDDSEALRGPGVLAVSSVLLDVFGLRHVVASLDHASVSLRGQC